MKRLIAVTAFLAIAGCSGKQASVPVSTAQQPNSQVSDPVAQAPVSAQQSNNDQGVKGWVPIMIGNEPMVDAQNNQYVWHPRSLKRNGSQVTYLAAAILINSSNPNKPGVSISQITANCQTRAFHIISGTTYDPQGQIVGTDSNTPEIIAQPGSVNEITINNVCNAQPIITQADLTRIQMEELTRARQSNAELINSAMIEAAKLFK